MLRGALSRAESVDGEKGPPAFKDGQGAGKRETSLNGVGEKSPERRDLLSIQRQEKISLKSKRQGARPRTQCDRPGCTWANSHPR